jgi:tetratricopeptide (TPR) repeat protein
VPAASGDVIGNRFEIERQARAGGMCVVYRARDRSTGEYVAVKMPHAGRTNADLERRFAREARVLAKLSHPSIVKHVAHGSKPAYLAMEWLEGEDLAERLTNGALSVNDTLTVGLRVGAALAAAHAAGVIHRDIKPSNLFLVDGRADRVKVLDFGIARLGARAADLTHTGVRMGTPPYMSPEQARGAIRLDARADVFALGCVLYECLTGERAFGGDDTMAVLAKVLLMSAPQVVAVRPTVPKELDALIERMMAKDPAARPTLEEVARTLTTIAATAHAQTDVGPAPAERKGPHTTLTRSELRLVSLVLIGPAKQRGVPAIIKAIATRHGAVMERLADGSSVLVFAEALATDLAAKAARCAIELRARVAAPVVVATGRSTAGTRVPIGEAIDRASALVRGAKKPPPTKPGSGPRHRAARGKGAAIPAVLVDEVTAALVDLSFDIHTTDGRPELRGEKPAAGTRTLLGKPSPFVGRDRELAALRGYLAECTGDSVARVVLVTGEPGSGKSRLAHEWMRELRAQGGVEILIARGDPLSAGSPFGMIAQLVRRAADVKDGEPLEARQEKLRARLATLGADATLPWLAELAGAPLPDETDVALREARRDPRLMGDRLRAAFERWIAAEVARSPVVVMLEDLHWGDRPSIDFLGAAARAIGDQPLLVLALARPEVHELYPSPFGVRDLQELRLGALTPRAAERLVVKVLGDRATPAQVAEVIERAQGNAFYLEELIRAVAEGKRHLPESVVAMVQARLEELEDDARLVLRAASVFGRRFWREGVAALLGDRAVDLGAWLSALESAEVVNRRGEARFAGRTEYTFQHALVREAAYAMLTDEDRALGHRLAAAWLEAAGEPDGVVLAEHFERGGEPARAVGFWRTTAAHALQGDDLAAAIARAERGLDCGALGEDAGELQLTAAEAHNWRGEYEAGARNATLAMSNLPRGGDAWCVAAGVAAANLGKLSKRDEMVAIAEELRASGPMTSARATALARVANQCTANGRIAFAAELDAAIEASASREVIAEPLAAMRLHMLRASLADSAGDVAESLAHTVTALGIARAIGHTRLAHTFQMHLGYVYAVLGEMADAERTLEELLADPSTVALPEVTGAARHVLGMAQACLGEHARGAANERAAIDQFVAIAHPRLESASRTTLVRILLLAGDVAGALRAADEAVAQSNTLDNQLTDIEAFVVLADAKLADGRGADALAAVTRAIELMDEAGGVDGGDILLRVVHAEALRATGDVDRARDVVTLAHTELHARAEKISDPARRASFLDKVPENARLRALYRALT